MFSYTGHNAGSYALWKKEEQLDDNEWIFLNPGGVWKWSNITQEKEMLMDFNPEEQSRITIQQILRYKACIR